MNSVSRGELQILAQTLLRSNNVEVGDDPRDEITIARALGHLTLSDEIVENVGLAATPSEVPAPATPLPRPRALITA